MKQTFKLNKENISLENSASLIDALNLAEQGDIIEIVIDSPGGDTDAEYTIIRAMQQTKAKVYCIVTGWAASVAADIAMVFPENLILTAAAKFMFHLVVDEDNSTMIELTDQDRYDRFCNNFVLDTLGDLFTIVELTEIKLGNELVLTGQEIKSRLKRIRGIEVN